MSKVGLHGIVALVFAVAAVSLPLDQVQAYGGVAGTCTYMFYIKNSLGQLDLSTSTEVAIYKIGTDGQSLGAKLASAKPNGTPTATAKASVVLQLNAYTEGDATTAEFGEQLAVVVTARNYYGDPETWMSYTALPKPTFFGTYELAGLLGDYTGTNGTDCAGLPTSYVAALDYYSDYYLWETGYPSANADCDNDGMTMIEEFYAGTDPIGGRLATYGPQLFDTLTLRDWSVSGRNATVKIDKNSGHSYSIRWTTQNPKITTLGQEVPTGAAIRFATTENGTQDQYAIYSTDDYTTQQVWFTLPDVQEDYYVGIAVDGVLCAYTQISAAAPSDPLQQLIDTINASDATLTEAQKVAVSNNVMAVAALIDGDNAAKASAIESWLDGMDGGTFPEAAEIADSRLALTYRLGTATLLTSAVEARIVSFALDGDIFVLTFGLSKNGHAISLAPVETSAVAELVVCSEDITFQDETKAFAPDRIILGVGNAPKVAIPAGHPQAFCKISF